MPKNVLQVRRVRDYGINKLLLDEHRDDLIGKHEQALEDLERDYAGIDNISGRAYRRTAKDRLDELPQYDPLEARGIYLSLNNLSPLEEYALWAATSSLRLREKARLSSDTTTNNPPLKTGLNEKPDPTVTRGGSHLTGKAQCPINSKLALT